LNIKLPIFLFSGYKTSLFFFISSEHALIRAPNYIIFKEKKLINLKKDIEGEIRLYIPYLKSQIPEEHTIKKFLEYDKSKNQIYDNLYFNDCKIVVKVSIPQNSDSGEIGRFKICNNLFLTSY